MAEFPAYLPVQVVVGQVVTVKPGCGLSLAQCLERRPHLLREQLWLFPGGEVAALVDLVEVDEVGVDLLGPGARGLTRDHILDNITLYWLTGTATSSARLYWEQGRTIAALIASGKKPPKLSLPVGFTVFPGEIFRAPRSWVEQGYPNLIYFNEVDKGGHFAAWEEPELFTTEIRAAFKSLR